MARPLPRLETLHEELLGCRACPEMIGPVVTGRPVKSQIFLIGQAPGPREGSFGRPFAWTAGKTMFGWFRSIGPDEETFRARAYMAAVCRCFPGKNGSGGDRVPNREEIERCARWMSRELALLRPALVIPVGRLAIEQVLGASPKLDEVIGGVVRARLHGVAVEAVPLPHPSGLSTWYKREPGKTLLARALQALAKHPAWRATFKGVTAKP